MLDHAQVLADLRSLTQSDEWPRSISKWRNAFSTNCLAFAFGLDLPDPNSTAFYGSFYSISHPNANYEEKEKIPPATFAMHFEDTCKALGLTYRRIVSPNDAFEDEYVMALWGLYSTVDNRVPLSLRPSTVMTSMSFGGIWMVPGSTKRAGVPDPKLWNGNAYLSSIPSALCTSL